MRRPKFYNPAKRKPLEKSIEAAIGRYAVSKGCLWWKFTSPNNRSVPDRVVVTPVGVTAFMEIKREGNELTPGQLEKAKDLRDHNALVDWTDNLEKGKKLIDLWCSLPILQTRACGVKKTLEGVWSEENIGGGVVKTDAKFSRDRLHRLCLSRHWDVSKPAVAFIGLNPSTADENLDDPTIRRCINFAQSWGGGSLYMLNLFSLRATDPNVMKAHEKPNTEENNQWLLEIARQSEIVVAAWGNHGSHQGRDKDVIEKLGWMGLEVMCLGFNKDGSPKHPLYVPANMPLVPFNSTWADIW